MTAQRLTPLTPEDLSPQQRDVYDAIAAGPRAGGPFPLTRADGSLRGPFGALLLAPELGEAVQALGSAVRFGGALPDRAREIAILLVAAHWDSAFEREAHEAVGTVAGLTADELAALRRGDTTVFEGVERVVADTAAQLAAGDLDDAQWQRAERELGAAGVFELSTLVGYYALLALQLRVFRIAD